jgi:glycerol-3-phosphate dehydrogenase
LTLPDVTLVHRGLLPAVTGRNGAAELLAAPRVLDHAHEGGKGAVTVIGVKYVTARGLAERAVNAIARPLGRRLPASRTGSMFLPGAGQADFEGLAIETARKLHFDVPEPAITRLAARYSEAAAEIVRMMAEEASLRSPLSLTVPTVGAEVVHVIRHEMAVHLSDIVMRRTGLGAREHPGAEALAACAGIAAAELNWTAARQADEIAAVDRLFQIASSSASVAVSKR